MRYPTVKMLMRTAIAASGLWLADAGATSTPAPSSSCATPDLNTPAITTCYYDLTHSPSSTQSPTSAVLNKGIFRVPSAAGDLGKGTTIGTGEFQPFVRIQETANGSTLKSNGIESGFNTGGEIKDLLDNHDKGNSNWNHAIKLSDIAKVTVCDGGGTTGANCHQYYEFLLDTNEQGNSPNSGLSLDEFKLFWAGSSTLTAFTGANDNSGFTSFNITGANLAYDMDAGPGGDASILMDYRNFSGSGNGVDLQTLIPMESLAGATKDSYLYLYSKFGATGSKCLNPTTGNGTINGDSPCKTPDGTTGLGKSISPKNTPTPAGSLQMAGDAGFEEWSARKGANGSGGPLSVDLPATSLLFGAGLIAMVNVRRSRRVS